MVKGAALLLQEDEKLETVPEVSPPPEQIQSQTPGQQEQHLHLMMRLLRPEDAIRLAVRLESAQPQRIRYLLVVSTEEKEGESETVLLGVDFPEEGSSSCTLGMALPLWSDAQVFLDGDGGFSVTSGGKTRIFKPISVQTMWSVLQVLHKACSDAIQNNHFPGGSALGWAERYQGTVASEQSCINEWLAMSDLESVRPDSFCSDKPTERVVTEKMIRAKLREVMATADLESITAKEIRTELECRTNCSLTEYKEFIDNEMLLIMAQMDRPSKIFDHLYLGSEWNAANLEELQRNRVTHILNVTREIDNFFPALFTYMNVRLYDEEASQLLPHWKETFRFISDVRKQNARVLVHCKMGVSRSASTVIAYAMKEYQWTLEQAYRHVQERRPIVHPNPGFMKQLEFYQGILDASRHSSLWEQKAGDAQWEDTGDSSDASSDLSASDGNPFPESPTSEEEPAKTPTYCFRPLREPPDEPTESPQEAAAEGHAGLGAQTSTHEAEELGGSDDSGAEEVRKHLAALQSPQSPGSPRRQRINLYAVMRSISEMESHDTPSPLEGPVEGEVFAVSGIQSPRGSPPLQADASLPPVPQSQEDPGAGAGSKVQRRQQRATMDKVGGRRGQHRGCRASRSHGQLCKQMSYRPAPGKVHTAVRHMEGPAPTALDPPRRRVPRVQHRLSVAHLIDAALVVSRTKEFEKQLGAPGEAPISPAPSTWESPPRSYGFISSRPRRMVCRTVPQPVALPLAISPSLALPLTVAQPLAPTLMASPPHNHVAMATDGAWPGYYQAGVTFGTRGHQRQSSKGQGQEWSWCL
uniref:protein-serine/threonine phosphatase n=1 Tax=Crocodylus porosus TaxID=8502 RepID=A0A7M4F2C6_CROPO